MPTNITRQAKVGNRKQRGVIYARLSKDELRDEVTVKRHVKRCLALAADHDITVDPEHVFVDDDRSGFRANVKRENWNAAQALLRTGEIGNLITVDPDRLHRQDLRVTEEVIDLLRGNDVMLLSVNNGTFDLNTVDGRERARGAAVRARAESERTQKRLKDTMTDLSLAGRDTGGPTAFGYRRVGAKSYEGDTRGFVAHDTQAPVVVEMIGRVAQGETCTAIARDLNRRRIRTTRGGTWEGDGIRRIALNPRYAGKKAHNGIEVAEASMWPALVDEDVWRQAVAVLSEPSRRRVRSARTYLLTGGLLRCGKCGHPLYSKPHHDKQGNKFRSYCCKPTTELRIPGCGGVSIRADDLEPLVIEWVIGRVESPDFTKRLRRLKGTNTGALKDVRELEAQLDRLADMWGDGKISDREWVRSRDRVSERLEQNVWGHQCRYVSGVDRPLRREGWSPSW